MQIKYKIKAFVYSNGKYYIAGFDPNEELQLLVELMMVHIGRRFLEPFTTGVMLMSSFIKGFKTNELPV